VKGRDLGGGNLIARGWLTRRDPVSVLAEKLKKKRN